MAEPARVPWIVVRGDDETHVVEIYSDLTTPVTITGRTYVASITTVPGATPVATAACTVTDGANGEVTLVLTDTQTDALSETNYVYDLQETTSGLKSTLIVGPITVVEKATQ